MQKIKVPLEQTKVFPLVGDRYYGDTMKCEFTKCEKKLCPQCQKDIEAIWIGYASSLDSTGRPRSHIIKICPYCGFRDEKVI